jgi:hypothetical protein
MAAMDDELDLSVTSVSLSNKLSKALAGIRKPL